MFRLGEIQCSLMTQAPEKYAQNSMKPHASNERRERENRGEAKQDSTGYVLSAPVEARLMKRWYHRLDSYAYYILDT